MPPSVCDCFVDEAGDAALFDKKGRSIIGTPGCSRFFILGLLNMEDIQSLSNDLEDLRRRLIADPYFRNVPSMQPLAGKTAVFFHARDDVPEVRREVFSVLASHDLQFFAVVKNKLKVMEYVRQRNERDTQYHYHPNELYDFMVRRLFKERLHKHDAYNVAFAKRGNSDRTNALQSAIQEARRRFHQQRQIDSKPDISIVPARPTEHPGLQAVDYFLWALQRLYERREERYVEYLWSKFRLVQDVDDIRVAKYGVYYTKKKPLTVAALEKLPEI